MQFIFITFALILNNNFWCIDSEEWGGGQSVPAGPVRHTEKNNLVIVNGCICFGWPNYMDGYLY